MDVRLSLWVSSILGKMNARGEVGARGLSLGFGNRTARMAGADGRKSRDVERRGRDRGRLRARDLRQFLLRGNDGCAARRTSGPGSAAAVLRRGRRRDGARAAER